MPESSTIGHNLSSDYSILKFILVTEFMLQVFELLGWRTSYFLFAEFILTEAH